MGLFSWIKRLLGGKGNTAEEPGINGSDAPSDEELAEMEAWDKEKSAQMESVLGKEHDMVMHALIPYGIGGSLDLYYYASGVAGTGIATKELSEKPGEGSKNDVYPCYELVMFTKLPIDLDLVQVEGSAFGTIHDTIRRVLNMIARYSAQAKLNPRETCEFPADMEKVGGKCLIFDAYEPSGERKEAEFGVMLVMEVHRSEMEWARANGGAKLIEKLKEAGHYPYSDMERDAVV